MGDELVAQGAHLAVHDEAFDVEVGEAELWWNVSEVIRGRFWGGLVGGVWRVLRNGGGREDHDGQETGTRDRDKGQTTRTRDDIR
jgi:hypothetical protein